MVLSTKKLVTSALKKTELNIIKLPSGVTLVHREIKTSPVIIGDVWIDAGVTCEPHSWSGMAHFLEHMIFKGTKNVLPGEFDYMVENHGGYSNAATSHDYAHFFIATAEEYFASTLPYLSEMLLHAEIEEEEFYLERDVVLEEMRCALDDHDYIAYQQLCQLMYQNHPYGREILGKESLLLATTANQMRCFHKTHYQPERMSVVMVGNINLDQALSLSSECFAGFEVRSECPAVDYDSIAPMVATHRQQLFLPRLEQSRLIMGWLGPSIEDFRGAIALDIISLILAGSRNSRLVRNLREERQLVQSIQCDFSLQKHSSLLTISACFPAPSLCAIENQIQQEIYTLQHQLITETELQTYQRSLLHDYIFSTETPEQLASLYGYYQLLVDARWALDYPELVLGLTREDIKNYACRYLSPEYYAICEVHGVN
ncbi:MAG: insulinase family protein [Cyanobacterium sp. T60_A2020_053]|nr:insulinase family protein [Cyanobacterium sp. T60_A2020_053]